MPVATVVALVGCGSSGGCGRRRRRDNRVDGAIGGERQRRRRIGRLVGSGEKSNAVAQPRDSSDYRRDANPEHHAAQRSNPRERHPRRRCSVVITWSRNDRRGLRIRLATRRAHCVRRVHGLSRRSVGGTTSLRSARRAVRTRRLRKRRQIDQKLRQSRIVAVTVPAGQIERLRLPEFERRPHFIEQHRHQFFVLQRLVGLDADPAAGDRSRSPERHQTAGLDEFLLEHLRPVRRPSAFPDPRKRPTRSPRADARPPLPAPCLRANS